MTDWLTNWELSLSRMRWGLITTTKTQQTMIILHSKLEIIHFSALNKELNLWWQSYCGTYFSNSQFLFSILLNPIFYIYIHFLPVQNVLSVHIASSEAQGRCCYSINPINRHITENCLVIFLKPCWRALAI